MPMSSQWNPTRKIPPENRTECDVEIFALFQWPFIILCDRKSSSHISTIEDDKGFVDNHENSKFLSFSLFMWNE